MENRDEILAFIQEGVTKATEYRNRAMSMNNYKAANFQRGRIDAFYSIALKLGFTSLDIWPDLARAGDENRFMNVEGPAPTGAPLSPVQPMGEVKIKKALGHKTMYASYHIHWGANFMGDVVKVTPLPDGPIWHAYLPWKSLPISRVTNGKGYTKPMEYRTRKAAINALITAAKERGTV